MVLVDGLFGFGLLLFQFWVLVVPVFISHDYFGSKRVIRRDEVRESSVNYCDLAPNSWENEILHWNQ